VVLGSRYLYVQGRAFRSDFSLPDELEELFIKNKLLDEESCSKLNVSKTKHLITQVLRRCNESRTYKPPIGHRVNSIASQLKLSNIEKQVMLENGAYLQMSKSFWDMQIYQQPRFTPM